MQCDADGHRLSEDRIVGIGHVSEDVAHVLVDVDGAISRRGGAVVARRVAAERPHTFRVGGRLNLEAAREAKRTPQCIDRVENHGGPHRNSGDASGGAGFGHQGLLQRPGDFMRAAMVHAGMAFVRERNGIPLFGREGAPGLHQLAAPHARPCHA